VSNLALRFITGFIGVAIMAGCILWGAAPFCLLFLFISLASLHEFYTLSEKSGVRPQKYLGLVTGLTVFLAVSIFSTTVTRYDFYPQLLFIPFAFSIFIAELYRNSEKPFNNIGWTLLGIFYIPFSLALFTWISFTNIFTGYEPGFILGFLIILWAGDIGAYFIGIKFGKHRLFERHSPKKTWEGSFGGAIASFLAAFLVSTYFDVMPLIHWMVVTAIIIVTSTLGDLVESMFKRSIEIKDSGSALPGHGGFLDRFDGIFISAPFVFTYLKIIAW
jgi:phosphatidate cytidylyltransferase